MADYSAQRDYETRMRASGYAQPKFWIPDTPEARAAMKALAERLRREYAHGHKLPKG